MIKRFIKQEPVIKWQLKYTAGRVTSDFIIAKAQIGAIETFSIGQPVYDIDDNKMGYMQMVLHDGLDYGSERNGEKIPVECWGIGNRTIHCIPGKKVKTYWQRWQYVEENSNE